jgi:hypothetical protein
MKGRITFRNTAPALHTRETAPADVAAARRGLKEAEAALLSGRYSLVILDEASIAVRLRLFPRRSSSAWPPRSFLRRARHHRPIRAASLSAQPTRHGDEGGEALLPGGRKARRGSRGKFQIRDPKAQ